jgi:hypothetical protein
VLVIEGFDPITVDDVITAFKSSQSSNTVMSIHVWIVNRNSAIRTDIEKQRMMCDQIHFVPILPEAVACRAVTSLLKPDCPDHNGQMMKTHFKVECKGANFENYDKIYSTGTWSFPVRGLLVPDGAVILPIHPAYSAKSTLTESLWEIQVHSCDNGSRMHQCIHNEESFTPVASTESIRVLLCLAAAQGKQVFVLDVHNASQNTIQFDAQKRTCTMLPTFFSEYLRLHWPDHPDLEAITTDPRLYDIQFFWSIQGHKDAGRFWYHLLKWAFENVGLRHSDHAVFRLEGARV